MSIPNTRILRSVRDDLGGPFINLVVVVPSWDYVYFVGIRRGKVWCYVIMIDS